MKYAHLISVFLLTAMATTSLTACGNSEKTDTASVTAEADGETSEDGTAPDASEEETVDEKEPVTPETDGYLEDLTVSDFLSAATEKYPDLTEQYKTLYHTTVYASQDGDMDLTLTTDGGERISAIDIDFHDKFEVPIAEVYDKSLGFATGLLIQDEDSVEDFHGISKTFGEVKANAAEYAFGGVSFVLKDREFGGNLTVSCTDHAEHPDPGSLTIENYLEDSDLQHYAVKNEFSSSAGDVSSIPFQYDMEDGKLTITVQTSKAQADFSDRDNDYDMRESKTECSNMAFHVYYDMKDNGVEISSVVVRLLDANGEELAAVSSEDEDM